MSLSSSQPISLVPVQHSTRLTSGSAQQTVSQQKTWRQIHFNDYFWDDAFAFLKEHASPEQSFLLPDELCPTSANAMPYHQTYTADYSSFDWALLHKGRLFSLPLAALEEICRSFIPVFANEVLVLFSNRQSQKALPPLVRSPHVRALQLKLRERKIKQPLEGLSLTPLKEKTARQSMLLIEQSKRSGWFDSPAAFVPLSWAATSGKYPYANLGDALSPFLVSALSGLPVVHRDFESWQRRLACVGTIAHGFKHGAVHFWGTGIDPKKNPVDLNLSYYQRPTHTNFHVHAVRGLFTAQVLKSEGSRFRLSMAIRSGFCRQLLSLHRRSGMSWASWCI